MAPRIHTPEEEIALGPAAWLWDYLRRSHATGFLLPLSGGADSAATATLVGIMCHLVVEAIEKGEKQVITDMLRIVGENPDSTYRPRNAQELSHKILHTVYMGTSNSSSETRDRAANVSGQIGAYHSAVNIDAMVSAVLSVFTAFTGKTPKYKVHGGSVTENLALQNIQVRDLAL